MGDSSRWRTTLTLINLIASILIELIAFKACRASFQASNLPRSSNKSSSAIQNLSLLPKVKAEEANNLILANQDVLMNNCWHPSLEEKSLIPNNVGLKPTPSKREMHAVVKASPPLKVYRANSRATSRLKRPRPIRLQL